MLTIKNASKNYGKTVALKDVSLSIPTGSCYGLVGPNGAGKSTLMKIIATVIHDYDGEVSFHNGKHGPHIKSMLGYIPQEICLEQTVTALQNLYYFGKIYGLKGKQLKQRAEEVLSYIGLSERGNEKVLTFSGGMKRRLNIGCALMNDPKVIIMDEPTVGIDPQSRRYIFDMITQLKQSGCTIIYASHYMEEVEQLCDEVAFIDQGKIAESGTIDHFLQKYAVPSIFIKSKHPLPEDIEQFGTMSEKNGGYLLMTTTSLIAMEHVLKHHLNNKQVLERLELVQPRLEDVFFSLTGSHLRD
ncbi:MAG TPA: ABC transporter ATP-binding protein [Candidatus Dormibacteraeota bacterium]|nr:ABC transporter ATP-binding protein [Candidatus Dormibacteraeota bacterium]